jgi:hypothetical protein
MRKHRHFALVIAALVATGLVVQRSIPPTSPQAGGGLRLASQVVRARLVSIPGRPVAPQDHLLQLTSAVSPAPPPPAPPPPPPPTAAPAAPSQGVWLALRRCESDDDYADDTGNGYYGAYQFSLSTWLSLGLSGPPSDAPPAVQDRAAQELQARNGWGQWPSCSRRLGLN